MNLGRTWSIDGRWWSDGDDIVRQHQTRLDRTEDLGLDALDLQKVVKGRKRSFPVTIGDDVFGEELRQEADLHELEDIGRVDIDLRHSAGPSLTSCRTTAHVVVHGDVNSTARCRTVL